MTATPTGPTPRRTPWQRLGRALTDATTAADTQFDALNPDQLPHYPRAAAVNADTLPHLTDPDRITALVETNSDGTGRLLTAIRDAVQDPADQTRRLPTIPAKTRPGRVVDLTRLSLTVLAATIALAVTAVAAPAPAQAVAVPFGPTVTVTVAGPTTRISLDVVSTTPMTRDGGHGVALQYGRTVLRGTGTGRGAALVHLTGTIPTRLLTPGTSKATITDLGDLRTTTIPVTVLRQSRVTVTETIPIPRRILVMGAATHYDLPSGTYRGDQASTVQAQILRAGTWTTVGSLPTAVDGTVWGVVPAPAGVVSVRLVRARGANVTGGVSAVRRVVVPAA